MPKVQGEVAIPNLLVFAQIAMGSASEVEYLLMLCRDLELINAAAYEARNEQVVVVKRMLAKYIRYLRPNN